MPLLDQKIIDALVLPAGSDFKLTKT